MPHSPEVAAALEKSIEKWRKKATVADVEDARLGVNDCPLCTLFYNRGCRGCPVWARTGRHGCSETPYDAAVMFFSRDDLEQFRDAAQKEVAFLESLRDPE